MPLDLLKNIATQCPRNTRLLGLDVGKKTIGLAVSDSGQRLATPLCTIKRTKFTRDILELQKIIKDYDIGGYVIGYPLHMDGRIGASCDRSHDFGQEMANHPEIFGETPWIALWDERLSTASVEGFVDEAVEKRSTRRGAKDSGLIDKLAAQVILQGVLEFLVSSRQS